MNERKIVYWNEVSITELAEARADPETEVVVRSDRERHGRSLLTGGDAGGSL